MAIARIEPDLFHFMEIRSVVMEDDSSSNNCSSKNTMHQKLLAILAPLCFVMASCVHFQKPDHDWATTLEQDLQSAQPIMHEFDLKKMDALRQQLHQRLIEEGDEKFARTLELQSNEVQTEVCKIMGLLEDSQFDRFPKTRQALSAAPKI